MSNAKQRRKARRKLQRGMSEVEITIHNIAREQGLERMLYDAMGQLVRDTGNSHNQYFCGYACQPIFYNRQQSEMISGCVLDNNKLCRIQVPNETIFIDDSCATYKKVVLKK